MAEDQLVNALTQECWVPHLKVDKYEIRKKALDTIGEEDARAFSVLPVDKLGSILNLAMVNPLDAEAISALEGKTGLDIKKVVATRSEIEEGISKYYGGEVAKEGGLDITQDRDSRRVTQMLSRVGESNEPRQNQWPGACPRQTWARQPRRCLNQRLFRPVNADEFDDVEDIDDLLSAGDEGANDR